MEPEATETIIDAWGWLGREFLEFGLRWLVLALVSGGIAVLGILIFGRGYKKRIATLEAQASVPSINQTFNFNVGTDPSDLARQLRDEMEGETVRGLRETIRCLPQKPLGDGHTYAALPDGTNIVTMADGTFRLALPAKVSFEAAAGHPEASFAPTAEPPAASDDERPQ